MSEHTLKLIGMKSRRYYLVKEKLDELLHVMPLNIQLEEINDVDDMLDYALCSIPAVLIDDKVVIYFTNENNLLGLLFSKKTML